MYLVLTQQNFFFFLVFQIWRISAKSHINFFSCEVKGGINWDWGRNLSSKNKCLMTIILEKKLFRKLSIHNTAPFLQIQEPYLLLLPIFVVFNCYHVSCKTWVILMNRNYDLNLGNAYDHTNNLSVAIVLAGGLMLQVDNIMLLETNSSSHSRRLRVLFSKYSGSYGCGHRGSRSSRWV